MTVKQVFGTGIIKDSTEIWIRDEDMNTLAHGNWYQDNVLGYSGCNVESFTWQDDGKAYIDIK